MRWRSAREVILPRPPPTGRASFLQHQQGGCFGQRLVLTGNLPFQPLDLLAIVARLLLLIGSRLCAAVLGRDGCVALGLDLFRVNTLATAILCQFGFRQRGRLDDKGKVGGGRPVLTGAIGVRHSVSF